MTPAKRAAIWHPFTQHALQSDMTKIARGEGAYLFTAGGRRIIDAISSWWVVTHGHCHPYIVSAIQKQSEQLNQIIFAGHTRGPAEEVAAQLLKLAARGLLRLLLRQRVDQRRSGAEDGARLLAQHRKATITHRCDAAFLSWRHNGNDVGRRPKCIQCSLRAAAVRDVSSVPFTALGHEQATLDALEAVCRKENPTAFIVEPLVYAGSCLLF